MEKELEKIRKEIEEFIVKYNVTLTVETDSYGRYGDGTMIHPTVTIQLRY